MNKTKQINDLLINGLVKTSQVYQLDNYTMEGNNINYLGVELSFKDCWMVCYKGILIKETDYIISVQRFLETIMFNNPLLGNIKSPLRNTYNDMIALESIYNQMEHKQNDDKYEYINWLEGFTSRYRSFDQDIIINHKELTQTDIQYIKNLDSLFNQISSYAISNNIAINEDNGGYDCYYVISYNNHNYRIGVQIGQGSSNYVDVLLNNPKERVIDYNKVLNTKKLIMKRDMKN